MFSGKITVGPIGRLSRGMPVFMRCQLVPCVHLVTKIEAQGKFCSGFLIFVLAPFLSSRARFGSAGLLLLRALGHGGCTLQFLEFSHLALGILDPLFLAVQACKSEMSLGGKIAFLFD